MVRHANLKFHPFFGARETRCQLFGVILPRVILRAQRVMRCEHRPRCPLCGIQHRNLRGTHDRRRCERLCTGPIDERVWLRTSHLFYKPIILDFMGRTVQLLPGSFTECGDTLESKAAVCADECLR